MGSNQQSLDSSQSDRKFRSIIHPIRVNEAGHIHFVTTSCFEKKPFFSKEWTRKITMESIDYARNKKGFLIFGYVLMPEHAHFLIAPNRCQNISETVYAIKWYSSKHLLKQLRDKGMTVHQLWKPRFYDFNVFTQEKLLEKLNYCHKNPLSRSLVSSPEEWKFSSYRNYELNDDSVFRVDRWWEFWR